MRTITRFAAALLAAIGLSAPLLAAPAAFWTDFSTPSYTTSGGNVFLLGDYTLTMPGSYDSATKAFTLTGAATITKGGTALSQFTLMAEVSNLSGAATDGRILSFGNASNTGWLKFFSANGKLRLGYNNSNPYTNTDLTWVSTGDRAVVSIDHSYGNGTNAYVNGTGVTQSGLKWQDNTYSTFGVGYRDVKVHSIWLHETRLGNATTVGNEVTRFQTAATGAAGIALDKNSKPTDANYTGNISTGTPNRGQVIVRQNSWVNYTGNGNVGVSGTAGLTAKSENGSVRYNVLLTTGTISNLSNNAWVEGTSSFTESNGGQMTVNGISDVASMNLRSGRWAGTPSYLVADTIYVLGGQLWPTAAGTIPAKVVLGRSSYTENENAYEEAGLRADANITVPELYVIETAKITQGGGTLTLARLTGSGNLTFAVYNNGIPNLTVQGATGYTGVLEKPNGTTTLAPNSTFGGKLKQAAGTIALAGGGQTIAKLNATGALSLTQTGGTLTLNALAGSGAVTFSGSGTPSLAINGATDYTGVLTKPNGTTTLASGSTFNGELKQAAGTVQLAGTGGHTVQKLTATGNLALNLQSNAESIRETFGGIQVSGSDTVLTLSQTSWNNFISVGTLEGEGTLKWNQTTNHYTPSTLTISGDNTGFTGSIETVRASGGNNDRPYQHYLVAASNTALGSANLYLNGANDTNYSSLAVNASTVTVGTLRGTAHAYVLSGLDEPTENSGGGKRSGDGTTRTLKLIGTQDGTWLGEIGANVNIEKAGKGTWTVGDGNFGTGTVTLTAGTLAMPLQSAQRTITSNGGFLRFVLTDAQAVTLDEQTTNVVWDGDVGAVQVVDMQGQTVAATVTKSDANVLSLQVQNVFTRTVAAGGTADYSDALWTNGSTSEAGRLTEGAEVALTLSGDATLVVPSTTTDLSKLRVFLADGVSAATLTVQSAAAPDGEDLAAVTEAVATSWSQTLPTQLATGITCQGAYAAEGYRSAWYDNKVYVAKVPTTRSVSVKIGARTATDGSIYPKHDSVGAYPVQGMFWNQAPLYSTNRASDGSYKGVMNVQDASGSSSMQFTYYGPNTYYNNTATVNGSRNARNTGNGELTYTYVDDNEYTAGTKTVTTGSLTATLPAAPNAFGWMVQLSDIPYDAYDLYFITASDANDTALHECPIYVTLDGGTNWSPYYGTYSAEAGGKTVAGATNWDGLPFGDGVLTEGRNYLKIRISKSLFGNNISTISVTHGARNTGSNIRSGLAAIQVVEVTNDGVYTREANESTDWFASAWTVGSVASQSWVNATNETPSYAKIDPAVAPALELTQDVAATSMVVAGTGNLTLSGTGALSAPILDATGLTGTLTLANTGALSAGVTLGSEATLALSTETERTYTAAELSLSGSGKLGKAGAGTAKLEFPVTRPVSVTAGKLELPGALVAGSSSAEGTTLSVAGDATLTAADSANLLGTVELRSGTLTAKADTFVTPITVLGGTLLTGGNSDSAVYGIFTKPITVGGGTTEAKVRLTDWHASANFQGGLTLRNKGYLQMEASGGSGAYVKGAVTVDAPAGDVYIGGANLGAYTMESAITGVGRLHLIQSAGPNKYTLSGVIADKSAEEPLQVIVDGGEVALTGTNTYTGGTVLNSALTATGAAIGPGDITVNRDVTLTLSSGALTVASGKTLAGAGTIAGAVTFADGAVLDVTAGAPTVTGAVTASGTVTVKVAATAQAGETILTASTAGVEMSAFRVVDAATDFPAPFTVAANEAGSAYVLVAKEPANLTWSSNEGGSWASGLSGFTQGDHVTLGANEASETVVVPAGARVGTLTVNGTYALSGETLTASGLAGSGSLSGNVTLTSGASLTLSESGVLYINGIITTDGAIALEGLTGTETIRAVLQSTQQGLTFSAEGYTFVYLSAGQIYYAVKETAKTLKATVNTEDGTPLWTELAWKSSDELPVNASIFALGVDGLSATIETTASGAAVYLNQSPSGDSWLQLMDFQKVALTLTGTQALTLCEYYADTRSNFASVTLNGDALVETALLNDVVGAVTVNANKTLYLADSADFVENTTGPVAPLTKAVTGAGNVAVPAGCTVETQASLEAVSGDISVAGTLTLNGASEATVMLKNAGKDEENAPIDRRVSVDKNGVLKLTRGIAYAHMIGEGTVQVTGSGFTFGQSASFPNTLTCRLEVLQEATLKVVKWRADEDGLTPSALVLNGSIVSNGSTGTSQYPTYSPVVTMQKGCTLSGGGTLDTTSVSALPTKLVFENGAVLDVTAGVPTAAQTTFGGELLVKMASEPEVVTPVLVLKGATEMPKQVALTGIENPPPALAKVATVDADSGLVIVVPSVPTTAAEAELSAPVQRALQEAAVREGMEAISAVTTLTGSTKGGEKNLTANELNGVVELFSNILSVTPTTEGSTACTATVSYEFGVSDITVKSANLSNDPNADAQLYVVVCAKVERNGGEGAAADYATNTTVSLWLGGSEAAGAVALDNTEKLGKFGLTAGTGEKWFAVPMANLTKVTNDFTVKATNTTTTP